MSITYDGSVCKSFTFDGIHVQKIILDGTTVYEESQAIGVMQTNAGGGNGSWARVDESGKTVNVDVSKLYPWNEMKEVIVDGNTAISVPKFYVKNTTLNGKKTWFISKTAKSGYHLHSAFIGATNGIYVGKYLSTRTKIGNDYTQTMHSLPNHSATALPYADVRHAQDSSNNWNIMNAKEFGALKLLYLIEFLGFP